MLNKVKERIIEEFKIKFRKEGNICKMFLERGQYLEYKKFNGKRKVGSFIFKMQVSDVNIFFLKKIIEMLKCILIGLILLMIREIYIKIYCVTYLLKL